MFTSIEQIQVMKINSFICANLLLNFKTDLIIKIPQCRSIFSKPGSLFNTFFQYSKLRYHIRFNHQAGSELLFAIRAALFILFTFFDERHFQFYDLRISYFVLYPLIRRSKEKLWNTCLKTRIIFRLPKQVFFKLWFIHLNYQTLKYTSSFILLCSSVSNRWWSMQ